MLATSVLIISMPLGTSMGYFMPFTNMEYSHPFHDESAVNQRKEQFFTSCLVWAIIFTVLLITAIAPHWKSPSVFKE